MSEHDERARVETLLAIMREHDLDALTFRVEETTYELVRRDPRAIAALAAAPAAAAPAAVPAAGASTPGDAAPANVRAIVAPVVGVFHRAPAPGAPPFVAPGDRVAVGQVVCIIEAMKMMNEITSDFAGTVARVVAEEGQVVSTGEDVIWIEP